MDERRPKETVSRHLSTLHPPPLPLAVLLTGYQRDEALSLLQLRLREEQVSPSKEGVSTTRGVRIAVT
jgi:hypothetical protein